MLLMWFLLDFEITFPLKMSQYWRKKKLNNVEILLIIGLYKELNKDGPI